MMGFFRTQSQPIGVDIGHDSVKMLQLEPAGEGWRVVAAARESLPAEAKASGHLRVPAAAVIIRRMLRDRGFQGRRIVAALPPEIVQIKSVRLPKVAEAGLEAALLMEDPAAAPLLRSDAQVRFISAGDVRLGSELRQETILLSAAGERIDAFVKALADSGAEIISLDVEPCAMYRAAERFCRGAQNEQDVHVLVDVGAARTQVVIGRGRQINFIRQIELGGRHFNEAVARKLDLSIDEAEMLRRRLMGAGNDAADAPCDAVRQATFDASRAVMEELAKEVAMCLRYHAVTFRGRHPESLHLLGGQADDAQLQSQLRRAAGIAVEAGRPLAHVDAGRVPAMARGAKESQWGVALGLCLKKMEGAGRGHAAPAMLAAEAVHA